MATDPGLLDPDGAVIRADCEIDAISKFGPYTEIGQGTRIANTQFGAYSYCDRFCDIANAEIGKFANIASYVRVGATDHPMDRASQHHFLYRSEYYWADAARDASWFAQRAGRKTMIGHDTWLGHACQIRPEIVVGHGAVVAQGAVVTKDVAPYAVVAGVPAVKIKDRHPPAIADRLTSLAWWDWDHQALRAALEDFRGLSVEAFLEKHGG